MSRGKLQSGKRLSGASFARKWVRTAPHSELGRNPGGDEVAVETGRDAAGHPQHRGGFARDVPGVENQELAGLGRGAIDQGDDVAIAFRRGGRTWHEDRLVRRIALVEYALYQAIYNQLGHASEIRSTGICRDGHRVQWFNDRVRS